MLHLGEKQTETHTDTHTRESNRAGQQSDKCKKYNAAVRIIIMCARGELVLHPVTSFINRVIKVHETGGHSCSTLPPSFAIFLHTQCTNLKQAREPAAACKFNGARSSLLLTLHLFPRQLRTYICKHACRYAAWVTSSERNLKRKKKKNPLKSRITHDYLRRSEITRWGHDCS